MTENHASDLYDAVNRWGPSDDFFLGFATAIPGARVLGLGCGTGGLTIAAANAGCAVTGVDPDHPSLQAARAKHGAEKIAWIDGNSRAIPANALFDVALMTSNEIGPEGLEHIECGPLRFRSEDRLRAMLAEAGLAVDKVFGGYHGEPVGSGVGTLTFTAQRP